MKTIQLIKLCHKYPKLVVFAHHKVQKITDNDIIGFPYSNDFKESVLARYPHRIIQQMLESGNLHLGLLLEKLEGEDGDLFNDWFVEYASKYSPLGFDRDYKDFVTPVYGPIMDNFAKQILKSN